MIIVCLWHVIGTIIISVTLTWIVSLLINSDEKSIKLCMIAICLRLSVNIANHRCGSTLSLVGEMGPPFPSSSPQKG